MNAHACERHGLHNYPQLDFNQQASTINPEQTSVGYLPVIQAPAHELDKLSPVVMRVLHVAEAL